MGSLSTMHRRGRFRKPRTNRNPLRKVVGLEPVDPSADLWGREILECGHRQRPREDFIGKTNALRRRCWQCGKEKTDGAKPPLPEAVEQAHAAGPGRSDGACVVRPTDQLVRRTRQCSGCPWKKSTVPARDIADGYDPKKHAALISCQATGTAGIGKPLRAMACHESKARAPYACVGWLVNQLGPGNNIALRLRQMKGEFGELEVEGEQYETLEEMVATAGNGGEQ